MRRVRAHCEQPTVDRQAQADHHGGQQNRILRHRKRLSVATQPGHRTNEEPVQQGEQRHVDDVDRQRSSSKGGERVTTERPWVPAIHRRNRD
ncbi:hypothetical protein Mro03_57410 [Microbispora rosea subsp. rosea]|nr:hypothetical protein Mro03_57410 [Microbispora rosea subsp. rosea]